MNENTKKLFRIFNLKSKEEKKKKLLQNDFLGCIKVNKIKEIELVKQNAEHERKKLAKDMGISLNSSWEEIVKKNNEIIEKESIRIK